MGSCRRTTSITLQESGNPVRDDCVKFLQSCGFEKMHFVDIEEVTFRCVAFDSGRADCSLDEHNRDDNSLEDHDAHSLKVQFKRSSVNLVE